MISRAEAAAAVVEERTGRRPADPAPARVAPADAKTPFPEFDCIRERLGAEMLRQAELRAERLGTGADRALIANGALDEEAYARALAASLGLAFEPFDDVPRHACPLTDSRLLDAAAIGLVPLGQGDDVVWVVAPRHLAARRLTDFITRAPGLARRFRLTTTARLDRFALHGAGATLADRAANSLRNRRPQMSAAPPRRLRHARAALPICAALIAALTLAPAETALALEALLALFFITWLMLRFAAALAPRPRAPPPPSESDRDLPVYTVIAALYREAPSVGDLLDAVAHLDYPREKLDVILALEADDEETRAAAAAYTGPLPVRVVVPHGAPRTKPRALNAALPFARGACVVVYDAEDRPEPNQLRRAVQAFAAADDRLACVQARLSIDNTDDGLLARGIMAQTPQGGTVA